MAYGTEGTSTKLRKQLRAKIRQQIDTRNLTRTDAAARMGMSIAQTSRLVNDYDVFSLDRLVDAAGAIGINARFAL